MTSSSVGGDRRPEPFGRQGNLGRPAIDSRDRQVRRSAPPNPAHTRQAPALMPSTGGSECHEPSEAVVATAARWARGEAGPHSGHHQCTRPGSMRWNKARACQDFVRDKALMVLRGMKFHNVGTHCLSIYACTHLPLKRDDDAVVGGRKEDGRQAWPCLGSGLDQWITVAL